MDYYEKFFSNRRRLLYIFEMVAGITILLLFSFPTVFGVSLASNTVLAVGGIYMALIAATRDYFTGKENSQRDVSKGGKNEESSVEERAAKNRQLSEFIPQSSLDVAATADRVEQPDQSESPETTNPNGEDQEKQPDYESERS
ncbi:hypothetical protein [Halococcus sp. AFM35]|uniref:hypothetical protein n=1 Tax=Halococcus sp. AFM35 TaxID=3421653 RepID=UPI003EBBB110